MEDKEQLLKEFHNTKKKRKSATLNYNRWLCIVTIEIVALLILLSLIMISDLSIKIIGFNHVSILLFIISVMLVCCDLLLLYASGIVAGNYKEEEQKLSENLKDLRRELKKFEIDRKTCN